MTAGGLVAFTGNNDAAHGGMVMPVSNYLDKEKTEFCYWVDRNGKVHGTEDNACK